MSTWDALAVVVFMGGLFTLDVRLEDRVVVLEKTVEACCGTEYRNDAVTEELHYIVDLRRANEELEMRIEVLERFLEGEGEGR